ncbi:TetR family transcriptional regulator [Echinicola rosea]|uniref:TetR family transcriptional regulator n=1 Tax=Echinicola rosea TaxID=1807691 RepID=A0ABQ1V411_9BACT|nr:TetR family transcriptional regulator [Echinicola rosea]GGF34229.1 TetR family transcriptional regulator [Echinicola rosea]
MELNEKKVKIMEVAEKLFAKNGFSGTSVREIAKKADVNIAMISYYFESKEKLLEAIFHYKGDYLKVMVENLLQKDSFTRWQKLDWLVDEYVDRFLENQYLHRIILRESGLHSKGSLREFIDKQRYGHYKMVKEFIEKGQKDGEFKEGCDLLMLYSLLPGTTKHLLFHESFMRHVIKGETGKDIDLDDLKVRTQSFLKMTLRVLLQKD